MKASISITDLIEQYGKEYPIGMKFEFPRLSRGTRFAQAVLNGPGKSAGEVCGIKLRTSLLLEGAGVSIMGYAGDTDPENYAVLVHEQSPETEKVIARVLGDIHTRTEEQIFNGSTFVPAKPLPPITVDTITDMHDRMTRTVVGIAVNKKHYAFIRDLVHGMFDFSDNPMLAPEVRVVKGQRTPWKMFYDRAEFLEYLKHAAG